MDSRKQPMTMNSDILKQYPGMNPEKADLLLSDAFEGFDRKIVVLDDDPTGTQTVHGINVYTGWSRDDIEQGFRDPGGIFYILTNSRSFQREETRSVHCEIGRIIAEVSRKAGKKYVIISRGDSTLRGHYPLETETLRRATEEAGSLIFDGEILCPFFPEGGRFTINDIHYVRYGDRLIPAGDTEFARDKSFGYLSSDLKEWCMEKYEGKLKKDQITTIPLELLQEGKVEEITRLLMQVRDFGKVIVNAVTYSDIKVFCASYMYALRQGKEFLFRSAAALPKVLGRIPDKPLLSGQELVAGECGTGGIVLVGSHVRKTTEQLEMLGKNMRSVHFIQFDQHRVLEDKGLLLEKQRVVEEAERFIARGRTVVVYTRRDRLDVEGDDPDKQLQIAVAISQALVGVIGDLKVRPRFVVAKGGITSSDVGTKALRIKKAAVAGQILPGIPVWITGEESKFPKLPFVIFPGNVGETDALLRVVEKLINQETGS